MRWLLWTGGIAALLAGALLSLRLDHHFSGVLFTAAVHLPVLGWCAEQLSAIGNPLPGTALTGALVLAAACGRRLVSAVALASIPLAASWSCSVLKVLIERSRPDYSCERSVPCLVAGYSMPSGHAVGATVLYGLIATLALLYLRRPAWWCAGITLAVGIGISWSRVVVGAHYAADVLAGQVLGTAWVLLGVLVLSCDAHRVPRRSPTTREESASTTKQRSQER